MKGQVYLMGLLSVGRVCVLGKISALSRLEGHRGNGTAALSDRLSKQESWPQQVCGEFSHRCRFHMNYYLLHLGFCDIVIFHPFITYLLSPFSDTEL